MGQNVAELEAVFETQGDDEGIGTSEKGARVKWGIREHDAIVLKFTAGNPSIRQYIGCGDGPSLLD